VELDGQAAHPAEARWRDIHRDNASAAAGLVTLRHSWADITMSPCRVAEEIAALLRLRGWEGLSSPMWAWVPRIPSMIAGSFQAL